MKKLWQKIQLHIFNVDRVDFTCVIFFDCLQIILHFQSWSDAQKSILQSSPISPHVLDHSQKPVVSGRFLPVVVTLSCWQTATLPKWLKTSDQQASLSYWNILHIYMLTMCVSFLPNTKSQKIIPTTIYFPAWLLFLPPCISFKLEKEPPTLNIVHKTNKTNWVREKEKELGRSCRSASIRTSTVVRLKQLKWYAGIWKLCRFPKESRLQ